MVLVGGGFVLPLGVRIFGVNREIPVHMWRRWVLKVTIPLLNSHLLMAVNAWGEDERGALVPFLSF